MEFDAKKETENVIKFIRDYYKQNGLGGAVVGVSGGKDSAVVLALFVKALGKDNVVGVTLPCNSSDEDKSLAKILAYNYGAQLFNLELTNVLEEFEKSFKTGFGSYDEKTMENSTINIKPRLRMASLYYIAAFLTAKKGKPYLVAGTTNKCEQYVGYFTKGGDNVCDIAVLADFTVDEVIKIGEVLGVSRDVLYRPPSDGLSGVSDEEKLGVTYKQIEKVMAGETLEDKKAQIKIERLNKNTRHKFFVPAYRRDI